MATNDFLAFAGSGGANVITQATYASLSSLLANGFSSGVAQSDQLNKVWRQSSIMAAVMGALINDVTGQNATDDGTTTTLTSNLLSCFMLGEFGTDTGAANSYQVNFTPSVATNALTNGFALRFRPAHTNTGASTLSVNGATAKPILTQNLAALSGGEIVANGSVFVEYNTSLSSYVIIGNPGGVGQSGLRASAHVNSSGTVLHQSGSITLSFTHPSTGQYTVSFSSALPSSAYAILLTADASVVYGSSIGSRTASGCSFGFVNTSSDAVADTAFNIAIFY